MLSEYIIDDLFKYKVLYKDAEYILNNSIIKYDKDKYIDIFDYLPKHNKLPINIKMKNSEIEKYTEIYEILKFFNLDKINLQNLKDRLEYIISDMERINIKNSDSKKNLLDKLYNRFSIIKKIEYKEIRTKLEECYIENSVYKQRLNKCNIDKIIDNLVKNFYYDIFPKWPARTSKKKNCKLCSKIGKGKYCYLHRDKCIFLFKNSDNTLKWPAITYKNKECKLCKKNMKNLFCSLHRNKCHNIFF